MPVHEVGGQYFSVCTPGYMHLSVSKVNYSKLYCVNLLTCIIYLRILFGFYSSIPVCVQQLG